MVQMQGHGHGDAQAFVHGLDHGGNGLKTGHVFTGAFGDAQDHGAVHLLRGEQDGLGPLQIVDVELAHGIMTVTGFDEHIACAYQHFTYLHYLRYIRKRICCSGCTLGRAEQPTQHFLVHSIPQSGGKINHRGTSCIKRKAACDFFHAAAYIECATAAHFARRAARPPACFGVSPLGRWARA